MSEPTLSALRRAQDRELDRRDDLAIVRERLQARPPRRRAVPIVAIAAAIVVLVVGGLALRPTEAGPIAYVSSHDVPMGTWLVVPAASEERLSFSEGSRITVAEGARVRVERVSEHGADLSIDPGRASVSVVHDDHASWCVNMGPYAVRVTGTRFDVAFVDHVLSVAMYEGTVVVEGPGIDGSRAVVAGQRFEITQPGWEPAPEAPEAPEAVVTTDAPVATARIAAPRREIATTTAPTPSYRAAAEAGDYEGAIESAEIIDPAHDEIGASDLLLLGDAARYTHHGPRARAFYEAIRSRYSESDEARTATFGLGLLAFETSDASAASTWMRVYLIEAPDGPLAREARGRLIEALVLGHDTAGARAAAEDYLARDPSGPHAALARHVTSTEPR